MAHEPDTNKHQGRNRRWRARNRLKKQIRELIKGKWVRRITRKRGSRKRIERNMLKKCNMSADTMTINLRNKTKNFLQHLVNKKT